MRQSMTSTSFFLSLGLVVAMALGWGGNAQAQNTAPLPDEVDGWYEGQRLYVHIALMNDSRRDAIDEQVDRILGKKSKYNFGERFGNPIHSVIPVRIRFFVIDAKEGQKPLKLDIEQLKASPPRLTLIPAENGDNWVFADPIAVKGWDPLTIVTTRAVLPWGGREYQCTMTQVNCLLQTFKMDPNSPNTQRIPFWMEFKYSVADLPGSGGPEWKPVNTPNWSIDMSLTADPGPQMSLGDLSYAEQQRPLVLGYVCIILAVFGVVLVLYKRGFPALQRLFPNVNSVDPAVKLWRELNPVLAETKVAEGYAFTRQHCKLVLAAVLDYICAGTAVNVKAFTIDDLMERPSSFKDGLLWQDTLVALKRQQLGLDEEQLSAARAAEIVSSIRQITTGSAN